MQNPTGRQRPTHPIPRPRPHGPADLGVLAEDLDYLAEVHDRSQAPEPETGIYSPAQVSGLGLGAEAGYAHSGFAAAGHAQSRYTGAGYPENGYAAAGHVGSGYTAAGYAENGYADSGHSGSGYAGTGLSGARHADSDFAADDDFPAEAAPAEAAPAGPIFVDASGRRRKLARRASLAALAVVAGYAGLLAVSFAGGPIPPNTLLPVPGMPSEKAQAPASTSVAENGASTTAKAGGTEHPAAGRPVGSTSEHRPETHPGTTAGKPGVGTPSVPQPTTTSSAAPPTPTPTMPPTGIPVSVSSTAHGNPTPPGHQRKSSPGPTG
ncbi:MAG: hypothetical protein HOV87_00210 [Catenulispora sp.]|nr:hypothetical protein [Catenulispora sp.]